MNGHAWRLLEHYLGWRSSNATLDSMSNGKGWSTANSDCLRTGQVTLSHDHHMTSHVTIVWACFWGVPCRVCTKYKSAGVVEFFGHSTKVLCVIVVNVKVFFPGLAIWLSCDQFPYGICLPYWCTPVSMLSKLPWLERQALGYSLLT